MRVGMGEALGVPGVARLLFSGDLHVTYSYVSRLIESPGSAGYQVSTAQLPVQYRYRYRWGPPSSHARQIPGRPECEPSLFLPHQREQGNGPRCVAAPRARGH